MWRWVVELVVSTAFGCAAAIVPLFNNEAYAVAARATNVAGLWPVVIGLGVGNGIGKSVVVVLVRAGKRLPWWRPEPDPSDVPAPEAAPRSRWRRWTARLLDLVGNPRWGVPLVALSAATSIPPIYPTTLLAATTRMRLGWFWLAATVGSLVRIAVLAFAADLVLR